MNSRAFGKTGKRVSEVGLGAWQLGADWGKIDHLAARQILQSAIDNGVSFIDTADVYGAGRSESLIGDFLQESGASVFVATKLGRLAGYPDGYTFDVLRKATEASLKRLRTEALDLTQLHCMPIERLRDGSVFDWLRELRNQGKIRHFGASVESMEEALLCLEQEDVTSLQIIFNIFRQKPATALFARARQKNIALIVRLPLASGLLSGKIHAGTTFGEDDHRHYNRDGNAFNVGETFAGLLLSTGIELANGLREIVPEGMSMAQMALRYILDFEAVSVVIPGASRPEQVIDNAAASNMPPLGDTLHAWLQQFYQDRVQVHIRGPY